MDFVPTQTQVSLISNQNQPFNLLRVETSGGPTFCHPGAALLSGYGPAQLKIHSASAPTLQRPTLLIPGSFFEYSSLSSPVKTSPTLNRFLLHLWILDS